jgi:KDO2-lipid IV(A) lauroyltransferase
MMLSRGKEILHIHGLMFFVRLFSRLPLSVLYLISDLQYVLLYHLLRYRRKIVRNNLVGCFPGVSSADIKTIEKKFYRNLCDFAVETIKQLTMSKEDLLKRTVFINQGDLQVYRDRGTSVLLLAAHTFNWEWMLSAGSLVLPMQVDFVYQPQSGAFANHLSLETRTRFGAHPIEREKVGRESVRRKDIVRAIATVADQFPGHHFNKRYWTEFMGRQTAFFHGIAQLAILMRSPVFFCQIMRIGRGRFEVTLKKIADIPATESEALHILDVYARETERVIRQQPENWLWSHNRWKMVDEMREKDVQKVGSRQ